MKRIPSILFILVILLSLALVPAAAQTENAPYVIVFNQGKSPANLKGLVADAGGELLFWFPQVGLAVASSNSADFASAISGNKSVQSVGLAGQWGVPDTNMYFAELDAPTAADDLYYAFQWDIRRVGADQAWAAGVSGSHDTVVAVIDTGIDSSHPDLAPNVVFQDCMQLAGPCPATTFTHWHGTHVAGTVGAAFDNGRAVGVGPNLGLAGYQVFEAGGAGAWDPVIWWAILDAADRGFDVINMSLGGYLTFGQTKGEGAAVWTAWNRVINYAVQNGVTVVSSAGNDGVTVNGTLYHIPGDLPGIINVAATGIQPYPFFPQNGFFDIRAFYSNYGAAVDIAAPGGDCGEIDDCTGVPPSGYPYYWHYFILSTYPGGYAWAAGTSMATPHVAGAAGLVMNMNPSLNPHQVKAILTSTADKIGSRQFFGHGMLDVLEAVMKASK